MDVLRMALGSLALAAICLVAGFFWGRRTAPEPEVCYIERPVKSGSIDLSGVTPKSSLKPSLKPSELSLKYVFIHLRDSGETKGVLSPETDRVSRPQTAGVDTLQSLWETARDWNTLRTYRETLFDNPEDGRMEVSFTVQHNRPGRVQWDYAPVPMKVIRGTRKRELSPFIRVSASTLRTAGIGGGLRVGSWAFDASYLRDFQHQKSGVAIGVSWSF